MSCHDDAQYSQLYVYNDSCRYKQLEGDTGSGLLLSTVEPIKITFERYVRYVQQIRLNDFLIRIYGQYS